MDIGDYETIHKESFSQVLKLLEHASKNSSYYKKSLAKINLKEIKTYEDYKKLPFTTQKEFKKHNMDFLAVPKSELWQVFSTSGSTGEPKFFFYDRKRTELLGTISRIVLERVGLTEKDLFGAIFFSLESMSAAGPVSSRTCESLKVPVIGLGLSPAADYIAGRLTKLKPNWFFIYPSTFLRLIKELGEIKFNTKDLDVKLIFSTGEPLIPAARKTIQEFFNPERIVDILASVDMSAYIASECKEHNGLHFLPSSVFSEVIDLETEEVIEEGKGELVLSSIQAFGTPLFRYRTGDIVKVTKEKCKCGREIPRIWMLGRIDDRIVLGPANKFFVSAELNEFIKKFPELTQNYQVIADRKDEKDIIILRLESYNKDEKFAEKVASELLKFSSALSMADKTGGLHPIKVELLELNTLERVRGKVKDRVVDKRES